MQFKRGQTAPEAELRVPGRILMLKSSICDSQSANTSIYSHVWSPYTPTVSVRTASEVGS